MLEAINSAALPSDTTLYSEAVLDIARWALIIVITRVSLQERRRRRENAVGGGRVNRPGDHRGDPAPMSPL